MPVRSLDARTRRLRRLLAACGCALALAPPVPAQAAVPAGYRSAGHRALAAGVEHVVYQRRGRQVVNVARIDHRAKVRLRSVVSNDRLSGPGRRLERTSSMCHRTNCLVGINADFFNAGVPVGGVVSRGELVASPKRAREKQLIIDAAGNLAVGTLQWTGRLVMTDLSEAVLTGVNVPRGRDALVLYTDDFGPTTETGPGGVEVLLDIVRPQSAVRIGQTVIVRMRGLTRGRGGMRIQAHGAVLSGTGRGARRLEALWSRVAAGVAGREALLRLESTSSAVESVGGRPVLVHDGRPVVGPSRSSFAAGHHPRTAVGWNDAGDVWLVTVDGRQPGRARGMSLRELAKLMIALGATEAINLDGGGSSTFVVRSRVANRPSDRLVRSAGRDRIVKTSSGAASVRGFIERAVGSALVVVPLGAAPPPPLRPLSSDGIRLPATANLASPAPTDPASNPDAALPAVVDWVASERPWPIVTAAFALGLTSAALGFTLRNRALRRRWTVLPARRAAAAGR